MKKIEEPRLRGGGEISSSYSFDRIMWIRDAYTYKYIELDRFSSINCCCNRATAQLNETVRLIFDYRLYIRVQLFYIYISMRGFGRGCISY